MPVLRHVVAAAAAAVVSLLGIVQAPAGDEPCDEPALVRAVEGRPAKAGKTRSIHRKTAISARTRMYGPTRLLRDERHLYVADELAGRVRITVTPSGTSVEDGALRVLACVYDVDASGTATAAHEHTAQASGSGTSGAAKARLSLGAGVARRVAIVVWSEADTVERYTVSVVSGGDI